MDWINICSSKWRQNVFYHIESHNIINSNDENDNEAT